MLFHLVTLSPCHLVTPQATTEFRPVRLMPRELILLSPYTPPTNYPLSLGADETAAWLHAWSALWHPAAIAGAVGPPRVASPYDHEQPTAGHLYAVPESPPLYLPDDWDDRVRHGGAAPCRSGRGEDAGEAEGGARPTRGGPRPFRSRPGGVAGVLRTGTRLHYGRNALRRDGARAPPGQGRVLGGRAAGDVAGGGTETDARPRGPLPGRRPFDRFRLGGQTRRSAAALARPPLAAQPDRERRIARRHDARAAGGTPRCRV